LCGREDEASKEAKILQEIQEASMTDIWVPGIDEIISLFEQYRRRNSEIFKLAEKLLSCAPKETATYSQTVVQAAQEVPELQRLIEREEAYREQIVVKCYALSNLTCRVYALYDLLENMSQRIIIKRYYFDGVTMTAIASELPYCLSRCWAIRSDGFRVMAEKTGRL
jgi:hypothetical protein